MARTARPTIFPYWYNMDGTKEDNEAFAKEKGIPVEDIEVSDTPFMVQLKPLNGQEQLSLKDLMFVNKLNDMADYTAEGLVQAIRMGLLGWKNINDADGAPLPFSIATALDVLTKDDLRLIGYQIAIGSQITEEIRKK